MNSGAQLGRFFVIISFASCHDVWFQTLVEIRRTDDGVYDCCNDQEDGDNGKEGQ